MRIPSGIAETVFIKSMLTSIRLHDHPRLEARKVEYVSVLGNLSSKVMTETPPRTQMHPQLHFLRSELLSERSGAFDGHGTPPDRAMRGHPPLKGEG